MRISDWSSDVCSSDLVAIGVIDADAPRVQMHLAADPAGQERLRPAIFAVADDRMADRRQMRAKLVGAAGIGLQLQPAGAVARPVDHTIARACGQAVLLVAVHLLASSEKRRGGKRGVSTCRSRGS